MQSRIKCCLIGIPDQQGVLHVGGRLGTLRGPDSFRRVFSRMNGRESFSKWFEDVGDVPHLGSQVSENHQLAAQWIAKKLQALASVKKLPTSVILGGGHDHGYSQIWGISEALQSLRTKAGKKPLKLGCLNVDAHLDLRKPNPQPTSGSPFYLAIEAGVLDPALFVEFGIQSHCNGAEVWAYAEKKKIRILPFSQLRGKAVKAFQVELKRLASRCDAVIVSVDLDSVCQAHAPGVSAPQSEGFTSSQLIQFAEIAGSHPKVISLGIFELNPFHDIADRTARLAATTAWHFLESTLRQQP